jgi:hypothetical protein
MFCFPAHAQNFNIDWFTIDGGGGASTGGVYSVRGGIGQPAAGRMSGGNYTLDGGFWAIIAAVQTPGSPLLKITSDPQLSTITLSWPASSTGFSLQQSSGLGTADWISVTNAPVQVGTEWQVTISPAIANNFYRLKYQ